MKGVHKSIIKYYGILTHAIDALERHLATLEVDEENFNEGDATYNNENDVSYYTNSARVGYKICKSFQLYGWFGGEVVYL